MSLTDESLLRFTRPNGEVILALRELLVDMPVTRMPIVQSDASTETPSCTGDLDCIIGHIAEWLRDDCDANTEEQQEPGEDFEYLIVHSINVPKALDILTRLYTHGKDGGDVLREDRAPHGGTRVCALVMGGCVARPSRGSRRRCQRLQRCVPDSAGAVYGAECGSSAGCRPSAGRFHCRPLPVLV